jgi:hypothetical protein
MILLLALLVSLSYADCMVIHRDSLLNCLSTYVDKDHDNSITPAEFSTFFADKPGRDMTRIIFQRCDKNRDNLLTIADWNATNACVTEQYAIVRMCEICKNLGWTN